jgi:O-antigen/teichoic acid export membrane protein
MPGPIDAVAEPAPAPRRQGVTRGRGTVATLFGSALVAQGLSVLLAPLVARALGPGNRGRAALVTVYDDASTALFNAGIPSAVGFMAKEGWYSEGQLVATARRYGLLALPVSIAAAAATVLWPLHGFDRVTLALSFVLIALSPIVATSGVVARQILVNRGDLAGLRTTNLVTAAIRAVVIVAAYVGGFLTLPVAVIGLSYSTYLGTAFAIFRAGVRSEWPHAPLRPVLAYGLKALPMSLVNLGNGRIDQLVIAPFLGVHALGLYAIGVTVNSVTLQFGATLGYDSFRRVQVGEHDDARSGNGQLVRRTAALLLVFAIVTAVFVALGGIGLVFGRDYAAARLPALLLVPGAYAFATMMIAQQVSVAIGRPGYGSAGQVVAVAAVVAFVPIGIHLGGLRGAALASTTAYLLGLAITLRLLRRFGLQDVLPRPRDVRGLILEAADAVRRRRITG